MFPMKVFELKVFIQNKVAETKLVSICITITKASNALNFESSRNPFINRQDILIIIPTNSKLIYINRKYEFYNIYKIKKELNEYTNTAKIKGIKNHLKGKLKQYN